MSPVPADPFPDFLVGAVANGDQIDARFAELYKTLDPAQRGIDKSNIVTTGVAEDWMAAGALGPSKGAFSAYLNAAASLANGATVPFDTEEFDVSGWFDVTTNVGRFTPLVAGYYLLTWHVGLTTVPTAAQFARADLMKNGAFHKLGSIGVTPGTNGPSTEGCAVVRANGTTDFFTVALTQNTGGTVALGAGHVYDTYFAGHLIGRS